MKLSEFTINPNRFFAGNQNQKEENQSRMWWSFGNSCNNTCSKTFLKFQPIQISFNKLLTRFKNLIATNNNHSNSANMTIDDVEYHSIQIDECRNDNYFNPELDAIVKSILVSRSNLGATIEEIRGDYFDMEGQKFPYFENTTEYLLKLPNVICSTDRNGTRIFQIVSSEKSQHLISMVRNQKPPRNNNLNKKPTTTTTNNNFDHYQNHNYFYAPSIENNHRSTPIDRDHSGGDYNNNNNYVNNNNKFKSGCAPGGMPDNNNCYFEDNYQYLQKFALGSLETLNSRPGYNSSWNSRYTDHNRYIPASQYNYIPNYQQNIIDESAHLYDYDLMGDDFLLSIAKLELGCKYRKGMGILQSGLCVSGQNINDAFYRIKNIPKINKHIILNIGSVDILQGHHYVDMQHDFLNLLQAFEQRGIRPILTTLAPLANHGHQPEFSRKLKRFNDFIKSIGLPYIDLWKAMSSSNGYTLYDCYQSGARYMTGTNLPHVLWNKIGRQRILNLIKAGLEPF